MCDCSVFARPCGLHPDLSDSHHPDPERGPNRRRFLVALAGTAGTVLVGCSGDQLQALGGLNLVPDEEVRVAGQQTWQRIQAETPVARDRGLQEMLTRVGRRIVQASGQISQAWEFVVFEDPQANAFALPNGKVGFYTGILQQMANEGQVAAVMGHEVSHVALRHSAQRLNAQQATNLGVGLLQMVLQGGNVAAADQLAGLLGAGVMFGVVLPYSRHHELEADRLGTEVMARAGYDPREALRFWQQSMQQGGGGFEFLSTHPSDQTRLAALTALLPQVMPIYQKAVGG